MDRKVAKDLLHVRDWLERAREIVSRGHDAYAEDALLREAGDSVMMKLGEAASRLARANVEPPPGVAWSDAIANLASRTRGTVHSRAGDVGLRTARRRLIRVMS